MIGGEDLLLALDVTRRHLNRDCCFTSDPGGFLAGSTKSETEAKKIWVTPEAYLVRSFVPYGPRNKRTQGSSGLKVPES